MTAKTSQHLADTLRSAGFEALAKRAEKDEFHDFLSDDGMSATTLDMELLNIIQNGSGREKVAAKFIRARHHNGEFDASLEESDAWANGPEGQAAFIQLVEKKK